MGDGISLATVGLSASVSVVTGYLGTLFNSNRMRKRNRRTYGLSLLAEIKSLQRLFRRYYLAFAAQDTATSVICIPWLHVGTADTTVFNNGSSNLGVFSTRTAVEIVEFYSLVRVLASQADSLREMKATSDDHDALHQALLRHLHQVGTARYHGHATVAALRREIPMSFSEILRYLRRRARISMLSMRRRVQKSVSRLFCRLASNAVRPALLGQKRPNL